MSERFVKLRYGLTDHLLDGRMSRDEYCVFSLVLQLADIQTGIWFGSGVAVSAYLKWCPRKCQLILSSLQSKRYLKLRATRGKRGNYPVIIHNYHGKVANGSASLPESGEPGCVTSGKVANGGATKEERKNQPKIKAAQPQRVTPSPRFEQEQRRIMAERDRRLEKEEEVRKELRIGAGPSTAEFCKQLTAIAGKKGM